jgi:predicted ATPase with chaperone activity
VVGLPDPTAKYSGDYVTASVKNSGFNIPLRQTAIYLAPADQKKAGPPLDIPADTLGRGSRDGQESLMQRYSWHDGQAEGASEVTFSVIY